MTPSQRRAVRVVAGVAAAVMFSTYCAKDSGPPSGPGGGGTPASIVVASASDTLATSGTMQFTATARDAAGNVVAITPTWSVVSGAGTITSTGMFTAAATPGTTTIRATSGSVSGSATIVVREANTTGPLATITVAPSPASVAVSGTQQFTASGKDAQGHTVAITPTWSMASGSGTISSSGLYTAGTAPGSATVKATSGSVSGTATVTVTAAPVAPLATIVVSPNNETILTSSTQQFSAVGKDAAGNTVAFTPTWSVSGGGTIDGSGLFTAGASPGTTTIRASQGGVAGTTTVVVSGTKLVFQLEPGTTPADNRILSTLLQPGACNAADTHALPITVKAVDQAGRLVPNGAVTLKLGSNPGGGTLSGTLTEAQNNPTPSYVTFREVRVSAVGNGYTLIASSPGMVSATSKPFDVVPSPHAPAVRLFFDRVVCTSGDRGHVWEVGTPHTIEVTAVDDAWSWDHGGEFEGNVVTSYSGPVTISVVSGGRLSGTLTVNAVNGRASFPDLVPQDGGEYVIAATAAGMIPHTWRFHVTPQPSALVFPQPVPTLRVGTSVIDGVSYQLYVDVRGSSGAPAQAYNGPVTLSIGANPGGASLSTSRGTTVNADAGTASFGEVRITKPGLGYTLVASAPGMQSGTSQPFNVLGMAFQQQPQTTTQGRAFSVKVVALDAMGNVDVTCDNRPAFLRIGNDGSPGKNAALCNAEGCTSGQQNSLQGRFSRGVAEFTGVTINQPGTGYTLTARFSYTELVGAESTTFNVTP